MGAQFQRRTGQNRVTAARCASMRRKPHIATTTLKSPQFGIRVFLEKIGREPIEAHQRLACSA